jgi:hypothetical protein
MNAIARVVLVSMSVAGLSACAGSHEMVRAAQPERALAPGEVRIEQNSAYIAEVERIARRRGIDVQWVNPPNSRRVAVE